MLLWTMVTGPMETTCMSAMPAQRADGCRAAVKVHG